MSANKKVLCVFNTFGKCKKGTRCLFAHSPEELMDSMSILCPVFAEIGSCSDPLCPFSHSVHEVRPADRIVKPVLCKFWIAGTCKAGNICRHAHSKAELESGLDGRAVVVTSPGSQRMFSTR